MINNDIKFISHFKKLKFVECPLLKASFLAKLQLIQYFEESYSNTDQDSALFASEFLMVVREILQGRRPVKLIYLTDFEGEEKLEDKNLKKPEKGEVVSFMLSTGIGVVRVGTRTMSFSSTCFFPPQGERSRFPRPGDQVEVEYRQTSDDIIAVQALK